MYNFIIGGIIACIGFFISNTIAITLLMKKTSAPLTEGMSKIGILYTNPFGFIDLYMEFHKQAPKIFSTPFDTYLSACFVSLVAGLIIAIKMGTNEELTSHGTAKWATLIDLKKMKCIVRPEKSKNTSGVILGTWYTGLMDYEDLHKSLSKIRKTLTKIGKKYKFLSFLIINDKVFSWIFYIFQSILFINRYYIIDNNNTHGIMIAPSRAGKGIGIVIPTCLQWKESMIVSDLKRENLRETGPYRKHILGHNVIEFAPTDFRPTSRFNPLNEIRWASPNEGEDLGNVITLLVGAPEGHDAHWKATAIDIITGVVVHLKYAHAVENTKNNFTPSDDGYIETNMYHVYEFLSTGGFDEDGEIFDVKEKCKRILSNFEHLPCDIWVHGETSEQPMIRRSIDESNISSITTFTEESAKTPKLHPVVKTKFSSFIAKEGGEFASVLSTAITALSMFSSKAIVENTSTSDFIIGDIRGLSKPTDLFLVVPPSDISRVKNLFSFIFQIISSRIMEDEAKAKRQRPCLLLIDEWPAFGKMTTLVNTTGYSASYGLKFLLIAQGIDQILGVYENDKAYMSSMQTQIYLEPRDETTAKFASEAIGDVTLKQISKSKSGFFGKTTISESEIGRKLIDPSEIRRLGNDSLIFISNDGNSVNVKSPKNKWFLNDEMIWRLNTGKSLDPHNLIGLRPLDIYKEPIFTSIQFLQKEEFDSIEKDFTNEGKDYTRSGQMTNAINLITEFKNQQEEKEYTPLFEAYIRLQFLLNESFNKRNQLTSADKGYIPYDTDNVHATINRTVYGLRDSIDKMLIYLLHRQGFLTDTTKLDDEYFLNHDLYHELHQKAYNSDMAYKVYFDSLKSIIPDEPKNEEEIDAYNKMLIVRRDTMLAIMDRRQKSNVLELNKEKLSA